MLPSEVLKQKEFEFLKLFIFLELIECACCMHELEQTLDLSVSYHSGTEHTKLK